MSSSLPRGSSIDAAASVPCPPARRFVFALETCVAASPERAFRPIERIGGETGWYSPGFLWRLRGWLDLLLGGVGMRRGRRDPERLAEGDCVDFWRVERIEPNRFLRLRAEMKLPGQGWLEFEVVPDGSGRSMIRQKAVFDASGTPGVAYWHLLYPVHQLIFNRMLEGIARASTRNRNAERS
jgi:hypothetical protein